MQPDKNTIFEKVNPDFGYFYTWKKTLNEHKSQYQNMQIIETAEFGKVLLLDGITQVCTKNDYLYHEPMVHPGLCSHPNPKDVLIIGGGDGGVLREVLKHSTVKKAVNVDLDGDVYDFTKKYLPEIPGGAFDDKRAKLIAGDGRKYVFETKEKYDAVIMDMTDPFGPSQMLYTEEYFRAIKKTFKDKNGVYTMHAESPISRPRSFNSILGTLNKVFKHVTPMYIYIEMYNLLWCVAVSSDSKNFSDIKSSKVDSVLKKRKIKNLDVINGSTVKAMRTEYPYISKIRKDKAKIITDKDPVFEDSIAAQA